MTQKETPKAKGVSSPTVREGMMQEAGRRTARERFLSSDRVFPLRKPLRSLRLIDRRIGLTNDKWKMVLSVVKCFNDGLLLDSPAL